MIKQLKIEHRHVLKPMRHQSMIFHVSRDRKFYALFWDMGTGKSKVLLDTASHLFLSGEIDGVIIISDNGCYIGWIHDHIPINLQPEIPRRVVAWSSYMNRDEREKLDDIMVAQDDVLDILCVNVEAFSGGRAPEVVERFIRSHYCMMVVDEATSIKNIKSIRTKNVIRLGKMCDYRRIATGTPITQSPLDLYAMCEFLCPNVLGFTSFVIFRAYYAVMIPINTGRVTFNKIIGFQNLNTLTKSIEAFSSRLLKTECLDLPGKVYETIYVEQTPEQEKMYRDLKSTAVLQLEQGLLTSTTAISTILKLHQINCGHLKLDDETQVHVPSNRVKVLLELLEKLISEKVVIWCRFQDDVRLIMAAIKETFKENYGVDYYGETNERDRITHLDEFKNDINCRWFVGTASTGGKGIDGLQSVCSYQVYYSNSYDREDRAQSEDRLDRKGQKNQVTVIDLVVRGSVDQAILESLKRKEDLAHEVLDKFRQLI